MTARDAAFDTGAASAPRIDFNVPFEEAIAWARARKAALPEAFYRERLQAVRARSFTVSGLAALDQIQQVADSLAAATAAGQTFVEWRRNLRDAALALGRDRLDLIFRTAIQTHYGIGRTIQQREDAEARPYLMWDAINDSRTRPTHRAMDNHIAPVGDPIWKKWNPPAGFNSLLPWQRVSGHVFVGLKAWYSGPVVEVIGSTGARLAVTAQHPVLTGRGWVAAQEIKVGDQLVAYGVPVGCGAMAAHLDENESPPTIEEVFEALALCARGTMQRSALNLYGDAKFLDGDVEVVAANRELMDRIEAARAQGVDHFLLALSRGASAFAARARTLLVVARGKFRRLAGANGSLQAAWCGAPHGHGDSAPLQILRQPPSVYAEYLFKLAQRRSVAVKAAHSVRDWLAENGGRPPHGATGDQRGGLRFGPLGNTAFADVFIGGLEVNPNALADVMQAHAGLVELEDVVDLRVRDWSGHVFDLETASGNILAYGNAGRRHYVLSNCRCTRISLTEAQARARGYPKGAPAVDPDEGWEGDPTEGNDDLVRVIRARQNLCLTTFAGGKKRSRPLWCDDGPARDTMRMMQAALDHDAQMPQPRALSLPLLPAGTGETEAFRVFMRAMGNELAREIEVSPIPGVTLNVSRQMFTDHKSGESKLTKRGRVEYLLYLAESILRPDEAWLEFGRFDDKTLTLLGRYARGRDVFGVVAVFKAVRSAWVGWSAYQSHRMTYVESLRTGAPVYRRQP